EAGRTAEGLVRQAQAAYSDLSQADSLATVVAYEPVWAIGTGKVASPEQAREAHALIPATLDRIVGAGTGERVTILYGGCGGPAQTGFGGNGASDYITNATMVLGAASFGSWLVLALMSSGESRPGGSLIQGEARGAAATPPPPAAGQKPGSQLPAIPAPQ